jgi:hypothetical protein
MRGRERERETDTRTEEERERTRERERKRKREREKEIERERAREKESESGTIGRRVDGEVSQQFYFTQGVFKVVLQKPIPTQMRQRVLYISNSKG